MTTGRHGMQSLVMIPFCISIASCALSDIPSGDADDDEEKEDEDEDEEDDDDDDGGDGGGDDDDDDDAA